MPTAWRAVDSSSAWSEMKKAAATVVGASKSCNNSFVSKGGDSVPLSRQDHRGYIWCALASCEFPTRGSSTCVFTSTSVGH